MLKRYAMISIENFCADVEVNMYCVQIGSRVSMSKRFQNFELLAPCFDRHKCNRNSNPKLMEGKLKIIALNEILRSTVACFWILARLTFERASFASVILWRPFHEHFCGQNQFSAIHFHGYVHRPCSMHRLGSCLHIKHQN